MKKTIYLLLIGILFLNHAKITEAVEKGIAGDSISIFCTPDLNNLTKNWIKDFRSLHPGIRIKAINVTDHSLANILKIHRNIGFVSDKYISALDGESIWKITIARDIIVPIINSKNPLIMTIRQQGVSSEEMAEFFNNPEKSNWSTLLDNDHDVPVNYYTTADESINSCVDNFLNLGKETIEGIRVKNEIELIASVQNDPFAFGFCKLAEITDLDDHFIYDNIELLPIDKNGNGKMDYIERIYDNPDDFSRGVWIGKYNNALFSHIYSVSVEKPVKELEKSFLKWILTEGQPILNHNGYCAIVSPESQTNVNALYAESIEMTSVDEDLTASNSVKNRTLIITAVILVVIFAAAGLIRFSKNKKLIPLVEDPDLNPPFIFDERSLSIPKGLFYDKSYTWAFMKKNGTVRIGINDFLQHITGPITRVKLKKTGEKIKKGEPLLSVVQNGKQLNINSPVSGIIKSQNEKLYTKSSLLNSKPYSNGWVYLIEPTNWLNEIRFLFMEQKYREWIKSEFSRLKDFFVSIVDAKYRQFEYGVLQDGGEIKNGILADYGPEIWEEFQMNFIDKSI